MITDAWSGDHLQAQALEEGAIGFLARPFDDRLLAAQIKAALRIKEAFDERDRLKEIGRETIRTLKTSEDRFRKLIETSPEGIGIMEMDGRISYGSTKLIEVLGYEQESDLLGRFPVELIAPEDREIMTQNLKHVVDGGPSPQTAYQFLKKDGSRFWGEVNSCLLTDADGRGAGVIAIIRDITDRKRLEEDRLTKSKMESLGILAGGIAHDFNNLLTVMIGNLELAKLADQTDENRSSFLEEGLRAALASKKLTRQFLTISGTSRQQKKTVTLTGLLREQVEFALHGSAIGASFSLEEDLRSVEVDEGQIGQCIRNIVLNAREAMPQGGNISVKAENWTLQKPGDLPLAVGDYVKVTIADPGTGIPEEILSKIFDPYFSTKERGSQKGMGLGLTICYSVLKQHGGAITVSSRSGEGTAVILYLPAAALKEAEEKSSGASAPVRGKLLVMDDEEMIRQMNQLFLERMGFEVSLAEDGEQAVQLFQEGLAQGRPFDGVILDLTIRGGMGGKETIQRLLGIDPSVKALLISAYDTDPVFSNFRQFGFIGALAKPYDIFELSDMILKVFGPGNN
jgi:PAS domain S-box-containing protein